MPSFDLSLLRVDRDDSPTVVETLFRAVDWPVMPCAGEGVDVTEDLALIVESVGYSLDGHPVVNLGRAVLDDLQVKQLRKAGWRVESVPGAPTR